MRNFIVKYSMYERLREQRKSIPEKDCNAGHKYLDTREKLLRTTSQNSEGTLYKEGNPMNLI